MNLESERIDCPHCSFIMNLTKHQELSTNYQPILIRTFELLSNLFNLFNHIRKTHHIEPMTHCSVRGAQLQQSNRSFYPYHCKKCDLFFTSTSAVEEHFFMSKNHCCPDDVQLNKILPEPERKKPIVLSNLNFTPQFVPGQVRFNYYFFL